MRLGPVREGFPAVELGGAVLQQACGAEAPGGQPGAAGWKHLRTLLRLRPHLCARLSGPQPGGVFL